ncbi:MAG: hypothetical protein WC384_18360 [Prolixibacteraceae bacterium]|jgi:hypothetical protein
MQKEKLEKLATERSLPCVTISMNTNRTYPDNQRDSIELKNLMKEAYQHVVDEFGQHDVSNLLEKIDHLEEEIDVNYNLASLHIFLSDSTTEIVKSSWPISINTVSVAENFVIKPLIKDLNRIEDYLILVLSLSDARLVHAINDRILGEMKSDDFPFKSSDGKQSDNQVSEFFNQIDKALVKINNKTDMNIVVVCTEKNWSRLIQVADQPSIYYGNINNNDSTSNLLAAEAWQLVVAIQEELRAKAIQEMLEAEGHGKVITDLRDIFIAAKGGRGDLLITHDNYHQPVKMNGDYSFDLASDLTLPGVIDDITSDIAWEVISKKGRAIFTSQEEFKSFGNIALKVRY